LDQYDKQRHAEAFDAAMKVYQERDAIRRGLWADYSIRDQLQAVKTKLERCFRLLEIGGLEAEIIGECDDMLNYTIYARRIADQLINNLEKP